MKIISHYNDKMRAPVVCLRYYLKNDKDAVKITSSFLFIITNFQAHTHEIHFF